MAIAMMLGLYAKHQVMSLPMWLAEETNETNEELLDYMKLESRITQFRAGMELIAVFYEQKDVRKLFLLKYLDKTIFLLDLAKTYRKEAFDKLYIWSEVCERLYEVSVEMCDLFQLDEETAEMVKQICDTYATQEF